jgi:hypothetical protein
MSAQSNSEGQPALKLMRMVDRQMSKPGAGASGSAGSIRLSVYHEKSPACSTLRRISRPLMTGSAASAMPVTRTPPSMRTLARVMPLTG